MPLDVGTVFDLTWKLLLVLGLAIIATRALRWLSRPASAAEGALDVLGRVAVGPQQSVVLLRVGKRRVLIGQTPQQISLLADLAAADLVDDESSDPSVPTTPSGYTDFLTRLREMRSGLGGFGGIQRDVKPDTPRRDPESAEEWQ